MKRSDFFENTGGLNLTDSPLYIKDGQATGGYNYDYTRTGAITKTRGYSRLNSSPDTQLKSLLLATHMANDGTKTLLRGAGTKVQTFANPFTSFTTISEDTATPNSDFFSSSSEQPCVALNFNTGSASVLWFAGAGATSLYGYDGTKVTKNGTPAPTGTFTPVVSLTGGTWTTTGTYWYALVLRKRQTQTLSNAALDASAVIANNTDKVTIALPSVDTTKYDQFYLYRSAVGGVTGFTSGTLVAQIATTETSYIDTGNVSVASSQVVPRSGLVSLDNSVLPTGTVKYITAYKRRMVAAINNKLYISDLDKPESWPANLNVSLPYGGPITGLAVIGFNAPITSNVDEYLVVFQERNMWVITGDFSYDGDLGIYNFELKYVDAVGCAGQSLVVNANGFIFWVDYRGIYMWNGSGKPIYISRLIEGLFGQDGNLDKTRLSKGWGVFYRSKNQVIWTLSDRILGENMLRLKLDLRLTVPEINRGLQGTVLDGIFSQDTDTAFYAGFTHLPSDNAEQFLVGDSAGYLYRMDYLTSNQGSGIEFSYETRNFDMGLPTIAKRFNKVVVYIDSASAKDLTLQYWGSYNNQAALRSQVSETMDSGSQFASSLWDVAIWDGSDWDAYNPVMIPLTFNLHSEQGNNEGDCLKLAFSQEDADAPLTIHGFSVFWEEIALRK
jgi:hypothetical protein